MKKVVILATGGTIAAVGEEGETTNYESGAIDIDMLAKGIPGLDKLAELVGVQVISIPSPDICFEDWKALLEKIAEYEKDEDVAGFVVTHGTDTLEETAFFLNLTAKTEKAIVITGSMRPSTAISPDGPMNLFQAVALAASPEAYGRGVLVVFSDGIYSARDVQKVNCFRTDAFNQKDFGCVGYMLYDRPVFYYRTDRAHTVHTEFSLSSLNQLPKVSIVYVHAEADPEILLETAKRSEGLVIAGSGAGWYSTEWIEMTKEVEKLKIPVVRCSRIANGFVHHEECLDCCENIIPAGNLPPVKSRLLLQLAMSKGMDYNQIRSCFEKY